MSASPLLPAKIQGLLPALVVFMVVVAASALVDLSITVLPLRFGEVSWRFYSAGLFMATAPQAATILVLISIVAITGGLRGTLRGIAIVAIILGVLYLVALPVFGLDLLQMRRLQSEASRSHWTSAATKTAILAGILGIMFVWMGIKSMAASRRTDFAPAREEGRDLVVGRE